MPPKKKEKPTCDVGTDPPDPDVFDPLDLDGRRLWMEFKGIPTQTQEALDELKQQNTTGAPKAIKDSVIKKLEMALNLMEWFTASLDKTRTLSNRLQSIHRDLHEIKTATKEIPPAKTWAQIAATNTATNTATVKPVTSEAEATARANRRAAQEKIRKEREPYEVTLTTTHGATKEQLVNLHPVEITKRCQHAIDHTESETELTEKPKLNGINRITNGIRIQCKSPEQAKALRTVDWNTAFEGLKVHKPQYGIVVHGVSTADLEHMFENEDIMTATIKEWESANSGLTIAKITRLRRKPRVTANGEPLKTQSVVVHTEDPHTADKCIRFGFSSILCITKQRDMHLNVFLYNVTNAFSTGIEPLTASTRKSVVVAEREITEPKIVKVQNILAVDARESIRRGLSSAQTELQSKLGWDS